MKTEREMGAAQFKMQVLALLDEVERKREPIVVTKHGRPVAKLVPIALDEDPLRVYRFGGAKIVGDELGPLTDPNDWEYD